MLAGVTIIFISQTWWDRMFKDAEQIAEAERRVQNGEAPNPYDKGAPDWQQPLDEHPLNAEREKLKDCYDDPLPPLEPPTKDLKHRVICAGVEKLIEEKGLDRTKVVLWCDWQCARGGSNPGPAALTSDSPRLEPLCVAGRSIRTTRWRRSKE